MKERPILFNAAMVRAILEGRKTQTRRIVNPQPNNGWEFETPVVKGRITSKHPKKDRFGAFIQRGYGTDFPEMDLIPCPFGEPGDRLWVRETWADLTATHGRRWERLNPVTKRYERGVNPFVWYRADGEQPDTGSGTPLSEPWRPSIHMPRWASRINLEVTGVRVERLNEISEADAVAEGIKQAREPLSYLWNADYPDKGCGTSGDDKEPGPVAAYHHLWTSINGAGSWNENPWVWVVEFKVLENG